jgi:acyl-homoserine lactone acylase PvdQ
MKPRRVLVAALVALGAVVPAEVAAGAEPVTIVRDSRGEPHIRAGSAPGALYGFAYAQMEDQADFVLESLAQSTGRSAELYGPGCLPLCFLRDQLTHLFRVPETAGEKYHTLPAGTRARLRAFAQGINTYARDHASEVPAWARNVTPQDVLAMVQWRFVLMQASDVLGLDTGAGASNAFVLDGTKTAGGKPILEGNPHLPFDGTSRWYAAQLVYPGNRVQGVTFRGLPGIALGSNGDVAWTFTANHGSHNETDRYRERLNPANANQYQFGGSDRDMTVRQVTIGVQATPGLVTPVRVRMRYTIHGPVISDPPAATDGTQPPPATDFATSATVSQFEQVGIAPQLYAQSEASSLAEFRAALRQNQLTGFHVLAADHTDVFYGIGARSGVLADGLNSNQPLDGSDPRTAWQGILPFDRLPQATDPPKGYYQNANNAPWFSAPGQIVREALPSFLRGGNSNGTRSRRQVQLLDPASNLSFADVERIGLDVYVEIAPSLKALLAQAAFNASSDPRVRVAWSLIGPWDGRATRDSTAYPLFATWKRGLRESALSFDPVNPPPASTTFTDAQKAEASRAMIVAYDGMMAQYGTIARRYGDLHTYTYGSFSAPIDGGDFDVPTIHMTNCRGTPGSMSPVYYHPCPVRGGSSFVFSVDMATGRMTVMRPVSDTDDAASPFYTLNARDFTAGRYREFPVTDAAVDAQQTSRTVVTAPDAPAVSLTPRTVRFHPRGVDAGASAPATITLHNAGGSAVVVDDVAVAGAVPPAFAVASDGCSSRTLAAGGRCTIGVTFDPAAKGRATARLRIVSDGSPAIAEIPLSGVGTPARGAR